MELNRVLALAALVLSLASIWANVTTAKSFNEFARAVTEYVEADALRWHALAGGRGVVDEYPAWSCTQNIGEGPVCQQRIMR